MNDNFNMQLRHGKPLYSNIEKSNIVDQYNDIVFQMYMTSHPNANPEKVKVLINNLTNTRFKDIPCVLHNNMTHEKLNTSIADVCSWIQQAQPIIAGNGTFLKQHEEYTSPIINFLETLQDMRKVAKKKMYTFKKGTVDYVNANTQQLSIKVIMNADYGGSGTVYSPFYSVYIPPATTSSAKNLTTTLICCLEFASGNTNKWCKLNSINELYDMMLTVLSTDASDRVLIHDNFSVNEVAEYLISKINNPSISDVKHLKEILSTLSDDELCKLRLSFDIKFVLQRYLSNEVSTISNYAKQHTLDINNITKETLHDAGFGESEPDEISNLIDHVKQTIVDNCIYPFILNDAEQRAFSMERLVVCTTDTDSLMVHFAAYIDAFQAYVPDFKQSCLIASVLGVRLFVDGLIPQMTKYIACFCNIKDEYYRKKFVFKNEFGFLSMALLKKKMYAVSTFVQEGNPRDVHDISVTGLSFKKRDAAEFLEPIMLNLYDKYVLTSDTIEVDKLLDEFYALRDKLKREVRYTTEYYKMLSLKSISSYDASRMLPAQMRGAIIWNGIRPDEEMLPMDRVRVIPLSRKLLEEYSSKDTTIAEILRLLMLDSKCNTKAHSDVICLPDSYKEIPKWLSPVIDIEYTIDQLLTPFRQLFELFNINMADTYAGMIPSRMICL